LATSGVGERLTVLARFEKRTALDNLCDQHSEICFFNKIEVSDDVHMQEADSDQELVSEEVVLGAASPQPDRRRDDVCRLS
jgi:hypothetical protein